MSIGPFRVSRRGNFVVRQTILQCAFAELRQIGQTWKHDVGRDAMELGRAAGDAIKLLDGEFKRAVIGRATAEQRSEPPDFENGLYGAFAERVLVADNYGATVILQSGGENFASRSALATGQNDHRPGVHDAR